MNNTSNNITNTDIFIIGAGPVGLFAIFEAGMLDMGCHIVDSLSYIGGQCSSLYPTKAIYDIPGIPVISAQELINRLYEQASRFKPTFHLGYNISSITNKDKEWIIEITEAKSNTNKTIKCKAIIIASGSGLIEPKKIPHPLAAKFENKTIFYNVDSIEKFKDNTIAIAGGGDSAADWAVILAQVARKIFMIHRREKFRCQPNTLNTLNKLVAEGKIEMVVPYQLYEFIGEDDVLEEIILKHSTNSEMLYPLKVNKLLAFYGLATNNQLLADKFGYSVKDGQIIINPATAMSSVPGVFAIGDAASYGGKLKLILTGFAEAATACHGIYSYLYPDKIISTEYSTNKLGEDKAVESVN